MSEPLIYNHQNDINGHDPNSGNSKNSLRFIRPILNESPRVAKIKSIEDSYDGQRYYYTYNSDNMLVGYSTSGFSYIGISNTVEYIDGVSVFKNDLNKTLYSINRGGTRYMRTVELVYTDNELPADTFSNQVYKALYTNENDKTMVVFSKGYDYDHLDRLIRNYSQGTYHVSEMTTYKYNNRNQIKSLCFSGSSFEPYFFTPHARAIKYDYQYTARGQLADILEMKAEEVLPITAYDSVIYQYAMCLAEWGQPLEHLTPFPYVVTYRTSYTYDGLDRIKKEVKLKDPLDVARMQVVFKYEYFYRSDFPDRLDYIQYEENGAHFKRVFEYDYFGQLMTITGYSGNYNSQNLLVFTQVGLEKQLGHDNFGNVTSYDQARMTYTRGNLLSRYQKPNLDCFYYYNHQGVRFRKIKNNEKHSYWLDGATILGEFALTYSLTYFYDSLGISGIRQDAYTPIPNDELGRSEYTPRDYRLVRDLNGNVVKIVYIGKYFEKDLGHQGIIAEYEYTTFGITKITAYNDSGNIVNRTDDPHHIAFLNPWRWKGHYCDDETGLYYIGGHYYDPETGIFLNASRPEEVLANAGSFGITNPNSCGISPVHIIALATAFFIAMEELQIDPVYIREKPYNWWDYHIGEIIAWVFRIIIAVIVAVLLIAISIYCPPLGLLIDIGFMGWGVYNYIQDPSAENAAWLAFDIMMMFISVTVIRKGVGAADIVTTTAKLDDVAEARKVVASGNLLDDLTEIIGAPHAGPDHQKEMIRIANELATEGNYSKIYLNRTLSTTGVEAGNFLKPDIIALRKSDNLFDLIEVASKSQAMGTPGYEQLLNKIGKISELPQVNRVGRVEWRNYGRIFWNK
jgi:RHS repeat-associated protein